MFGCTNKKFGKFLERSTKNLRLSYENNTWDHIVHVSAIDEPNKFQRCITLGASYVKKIHALNDCFPDLPIFNAANFSALIIIQAIIMTKSQIPNCGSKGYCWSFNMPKKKVTRVRENSRNLRKHSDMSVRTK